MDKSADFEINKNFKSGFVSILGLPSSGKSTLINSFLGEKLSITSSKPQTTRNHIKAILNGKDYQIVFIDTPGFLKPKNQLEKNMLIEISKAESCDITCVIAEPNIEKLKMNIAFFEKLRTAEKTFLVINKIDIYQKENILETQKILEPIIKPNDIFLISALNGENTSQLKQKIISNLPFANPYYSKDILSDKWLRFFVAEFIRETIFSLYSDEIPYLCAIEIEEFKEERKYISALVHVSKESHKPILIGRNGKAIKKLREISEKKIQKITGENYLLHLEIKVTPNWQEDQRFLKKLYEY
jgi:GTP-binding protein Era